MLVAPAVGGASGGASCAVRRGLTGALAPSESPAGQVSTSLPLGPPHAQGPAQDIVDGSGSDLVAVLGPGEGVGVDPGPRSILEGRTRPADVAPRPGLDTTGSWSNSCASFVTPTDPWSGSGHAEGDSSCAREHDARCRTAPRTGQVRHVIPGPGSRPPAEPPRIRPIWSTADPGRLAPTGCG